MFTKSIDIQGVKATVNTETGRDMYAKRSLMRKLAIDVTNTDEWDIWYDFLRVFTQSRNVEVPFLWPDPNDPVEDFVKARESWLDLHADVLREWKDALDNVDTTSTPIELTPAASEKNEPSQ